MLTLRIRTSGLKSAVEIHKVSFSEVIIFNINLRSDGSAKKKKKRRAVKMSILTATE